MTITIIAAVGPRMELGANGSLAYSLRDDMLHFKETTMGHPIVMGRKTFESFPKGALPGRRNIVVTRRADYTAPAVETAGSLAEAFELAGPDDEVMVIGGGQIYRQAMPVASRLVLTHVDAPCPEADTFFPAVDPAEWRLESSTPVKPDSRSGIPYHIATYSRIGEPGAQAAAALDK